MKTENITIMETKLMTEKEVINQIESFNNAVYTRTEKSAGGGNKIYFKGSQFAANGINNLFEQEVLTSNAYDDEYFIFHSEDYVHTKMQEMYGWTAKDILNEIATCGFTNEEVATIVYRMTHNDTFKIA